MRSVRRRGLLLFLGIAVISILAAQSISRWRHGYWIPFWLEYKGVGHTTVVFRVCELPESTVARQVQIKHHAAGDVWSSDFVRDRCADVSVRIPTTSQTTIFGSTWRGTVLYLEVTVVSIEGETLLREDSLSGLLGKKWLSPDECIHPVVIHLAEKE